MSKILRAIGLMSGTSLDGIDVALIETDGEQVVKRGPSETYSYDKNPQERLRVALLEAKAMQSRDERPDQLGQTESDLTQWHIKAVESFCQAHDLSDSNIDLIGFHGQTVLHRPEVGLTVQLGDGQLLANALRMPVVYDLRAADVASGGQGAPLVPIYHAALAKKRPSVFVNIGGVANATFIGSKGELIAFDTGPGNALINDWMMKHAQLPFDEGGKVCLSGSVGRLQLHVAMSHAYFRQKPPKSLDRNQFSELGLKDFALKDGAATLAAFTVASIVAAEKWFPEKPKQWVICGGGRHNAAIMKGLRAELPDVVTADDLGLNGDSMEAEAWAYLAVRSLKGLPISFPGTTGVTRPMTGGVLVKPVLHQ